MTDGKYEEFKRWIDGIAPHSCISNIKILLEEFEKEQEKKTEKEKSNT